MNRNRIDLSQRRKDAEFNSTNYLRELGGFARKFLAIKCQEFILNVLKMALKIFSFGIAIAYDFLNVY